MPGTGDDLEERRFQLDAELRRREMAFKEAESRKGGISPAQATVAGAVLALLSGAIGAWITAQSAETIETGKSLTALQIEEMKVNGTLDLERSRQDASDKLERNKFETSLIFEAIKAPTRSDAIRNLKFFVSAGFISDPDGRISRLDDSSLPSLAEPSPESAARVSGATGIVEVAGAATCTGVAISARRVVTVSFCLDVSPFGTQGEAEPGAGSIVFDSGGEIFPMQVLDKSTKSKLAILELVSGADLPRFIDASVVRSPLEGERIYLAIGLAGEEAAGVRTCKVVRVLPDGDFEHDCVTGAGSAGAVVFAVSDNAILGMHHSRSVDRSAGVASALPSLS